MTYAYDIPRYFPLAKPADTPTVRDTEPLRQPARTNDREEADDADTTSDLVWSLAYWPWL